MNAETFCEHFATFAEAPNGVAKLRELILQLAVQGKLVPQDENESASTSSAFFDAFDGTSSDDAGDPVRVPSGWNFVPVSQVCTHKSGDSKMIKGQLHDEPAEGRFQGFSASGPDVWCDDWKHEGDAVIVSAVGARCGKTFKATGKWNAIANTHIVWPNPKIVSLDYLHLILNNERFWKRGGSAQPFVKTRETFLKKIGIPPLAEQRRIVEKVDQLLGLCDELAARQAARREARSALVGATLDRLVSARSSAEFPAHAHRLRDHFDRLFDTPTTLPQLRQAILQLAVQGQLVPQDPNDEPADSLLEKVNEAKKRLLANGRNATQQKPIVEGVPYELPSSWKWVRLQDLCSFENGDRSKNYPSGTEIKTCGVPFVSTKAIIDNYVCLDDVDFITPEKFASLRSGKLKDQDIVVVLRGSVGKFGMFRGTDEFATGFINAQLVIVRNHLSELASYTLEYFKSPVFQQLALARSTGSAQPQLSASELSQTLFPVPPLSEQKRIVSKVTELLSLCDALEAKLTQAESTSTQLLSAAVHHLLQVS